MLGTLLGVGVPLVNGLSVAIFGPSEFALRLPTVLASILSVVMVYAIGQRLYGAAAGLAAAWAMALSPFAILFLSATG